MKKTILTSVLLGIIFICNAQKVIENPKFHGTTSPYVQITKVVLTDTATILDFNVYFNPGSGIRVPADTWIVDSKGGKKLYVKSAVGIEIDQWRNTPESGLNQYTLFFPPIDKSIKKIDYEEAQWKIFDIELDEEEANFSIFSEALQGNWYKTDGSNKWTLGLYDDCVVYKSNVWKQVLINQNNNTYQVLLQKDGNKEKLILKPKGDNLLVGQNENDLMVYSKNKHFNSDYIIENDNEFSPPVFKSDTAHYLGFIKGYNPKMGTTGMVYVNNLLTQDQESYLIDIKSDGTFSCSFPMIYAQPVYARFLSINDNIYFEPGATTFQVIDISSKSINNPDLLFMGETAKINTDLMGMKNISYFNYQDMMDNILDMSPEEYRDFVTEIEQRELDSLNAFTQKNTVCKKALQIKKMMIQFSAWERILSYSMDRESAYRSKNNVPRDQREIPLDIPELTPEFFNFVDPAIVNNPLSSLAGGDYYYLINRIKFADPIRKSLTATSLDINEIIALLESRKNITVDQKTKDLFIKLTEAKTVEESKEIIQNDSVRYQSFLTENQDVISEISNEYHQKKREEIEKEAFKKYFNLDPGFAIDIMNAQTFGSSMKSSLKPLSEQTKESLKTRINNEFIRNFLIEKSDILELENLAKREALKNQSGGVIINETPKVNNEALFDAIMEKYKGYVVFVDFWATWCGPCRAGMETIKPLKEELKDKKIKFVYLTNPSSPKDTWDLMVPDIHGEHYYLTQDQWNVISSRFKVSGIPHYVLVDKKGNVVNDHVYFASSRDELKNIFSEYLE